MKGKFDKAIEDFDKAILLEPKTAHPYAQRGHAFFLKKAYASALNNFDYAAKVDPTESYTYLYRATLLATCAASCGPHAASAAPASAL